MSLQVIHLLTKRIPYIPKKTHLLEPNIYNKKCNKLGTVV
jgi:hypothetical protein